jgi:hydroxymethylbilane synthase
VILRIATRRSNLALAQSRWVKARLEALDPGLRVDLREYVTRGDQVLDVPLAQVGGKGLFTREIELALLEGEADLAVHSLKDLPSEMPAGLILAAVPEREDPADALILPEGGPPTAGAWHAALPPGARVGTSSLRRSAQLRALRPDLECLDVRGNVDTRLRKLDSGRYEALLLAAAGLRRLGLESRISFRLPFSDCTPAPAQGALGLQCRADDPATRALLARLDDAPSRAAVTAERSLLETLGGGCSIPVGAHALRDGDRLQLQAVVAAPDGSRLVRAGLIGAAADAAALGRELADMLHRAGAAEILAACSPDRPAHVEPQSA